MKSLDTGSCPRCNSKARHRRNWLLLQSETNLFSSPSVLLHVSPKYALARRLAKMPHIRYVAGEVQLRRGSTLRFDATNLPFASETFDAAICIHVLEHVEDDIAAMKELRRVLKPGGWALISVPLRFDHATYEDQSITSPIDRAREFGEVDHVRFYGFDIIDRLGDCGFDVTIHRAEDVDPRDKQFHGLREDENVLICRRSSGDPTPLRAPESSV